MDEHLDQRWDMLSWKNVRSGTNSGGLLLKSDVRYERLILACCFVFWVCTRLQFHFFQLKRIFFFAIVIIYIQIHVLFSFLCCSTASCFSSPGNRVLACWKPDSFRDFACGGIIALKAAFSILKIEMSMVRLKNLKIKAKLMLKFVSHRLITKSNSISKHFCTFSPV